MMKLQYVLHLFIFQASYIFGVFLCVWKAYQTVTPCQNFSTGEPANVWWYFFVSKAYQIVLPYQNISAGQPAKPAKYYQQKHNILIKRLPVATTVLSDTEHRHWGIGIPGYAFVSSIQARVIPPPSRESASPVTTGTGSL